jgi:hypothetical protein
MPAHLLEQQMMKLADTAQMPVDVECWLRTYLTEKYNLSD